jgi:hypothetical protein
LLTCQNITHLSMLSHRAFMIYKYTYHRCEKKSCSRLFLLRLINIDNYSVFSINCTNFSWRASKISNFILQIGTWQITDRTWVKKV